MGGVDQTIKIFLNSPLVYIVFPNGFQNFYKVLILSLIPGFLQVSISTWRKLGLGEVHAEGTKLEGTLLAPEANSNQAKWQNTSTKQAVDITQRFKPVDRTQHQKI